jgi:glycosyltransferase involved in cell wall biosynthesis
MPKVSVVLTSFNHEKYIREAIDSTLAQTFADFELIILDDCSSDNSWALINQYSDSRIKAFRNDVNKGPVEGLNKAISELAAGEYIAIHHSDDAWEPDKLGKQVAYLDANPEIGAVFTWAQIIDENGTKLENSWFDQKNKTRWQWLNQLFLEQNHLNHPSVLIRSQCYQDVGMYRYSLAQTPDAEMWSRALIKFPIYVIQEKLTKHRSFSDKSNTSGVRIEVAIRANNEWNVLRENFLSISNFEELVATFPRLERFRNTKGTDNMFLLAMACLYECQHKSAWHLGLRLLFDLLNDETRRNKILEIYSFSYMDFIRLTDKFDVYEMRRLAELTQTVDAFQRDPLYRLVHTLRSEQALGHRLRQASWIVGSMLVPLSIKRRVLPLLRRERPGAEGPH